MIRLLLALTLLSIAPKAEEQAINFVVVIGAASCPLSVTMWGMR